MKNEAQSTYALLVRSEEKGRGMMEAAVYALCILSAVAAIWQFIGQRPRFLMKAGLASATCAGHVATCGASKSGDEVLNKR